MTTITFQPYAPGTSSSDGNRLGSIDPRLSRTNYFDGQLLKASDLTRDQIYLDERLLELGQVLGSGIAQGLEVELVKNRTLQVSPGIAIAPSGRVLQLSGTTLQIDLQDSGVIADLNQGLYRRFNRGLYAVALRYAQVVDGVTEAYPADLASRRKMQVSSYAEGVELALIPLNITLPRGDEVSIRAALVQQFITHDSSFMLPTDEAIALGLLAIDNARPLWLDQGLVRRPLRSPNTTNALQLDLATHYRELYADVLTARQKGGRNDDFAASNYFRLLPPYGPIPKDALDPVTGRQRFFPENYDVTIAPVRQADVASIIEESAHLAPIDLNHDLDVDIMVLVPMSDQSFALRARQLEKSAQAQVPVINKLPYFNGLALRLFTQPPVHLIDTDANAWKAIWQEDNADELIFVRRPPRTAETDVSAVVLARGFELPAAGTALPPDQASLDKQLDQALEAKLAVQNELTASKANIVELQKKIDQLQSSLSSDADLNAALANAHDLKVQLDAAQAQIDTLKTQVQDSDSLKTALKAATDKINTLTNELDAANKKIADLQATGTSTDAALQQQIKDLNDALTKANADTAAAKDESNSLQVKLAASELNLKNLTAERDQLQKKFDDLSTSAATTDSDLTAAKAEITKLNDQIKQLTDQQTALTADLTKAQQAQATAEADSKAATLKLSDALTQLQTAQTDLNTRTQDLTKAKDTITTLQSQLDSSTQKVTDLQSQLAQRPTLSSTFPLPELAKMRGADTTAAERLEALVGDNTAIRQAAVELLVLTPLNFDKALWPSLLSAATASPQNLPKLRDGVVKSLQQGVAVPAAYLNVGANLGMGDADLQMWKTLAG